MISNHFTFSNQMCAAEVKSLEDLGIHTILKHFALNDCEADRMGLGVWLNEQTARKIYLKAFQSAFKKSDATGKRKVVDGQEEREIKIYYNFARFVEV